MRFNRGDDIVPGQQLSAPIHAPVWAGSDGAQIKPCPVQAAALLPLWGIQYQTAQVS